MKPYTKENLIASNIDYMMFLRELEKEVLILQEEQKKRPDFNLTTNNQYYIGIVFLMTQLIKVISIDAQTTNEKIAKRLFCLLAAYPEKKTRTAFYLLKKKINEF